MRRYLSWVGLGLLVACFLQFAGASAWQLAPLQVLNEGVEGENLVTLDPHKATYQRDKGIIQVMFNGLIRYVLGSVTEFEGDLAVALPSQKIVDGKQVWTFELRQGVMVHPFEGYPDGYELTSEDVVYSFEKARDKARSIFSGDYPAGMTVAATGNYSIEITMPAPLSENLFYPKVANYQGGNIVPKKAVEALGDADFGLHPVGTGPFMFESYVSNYRTTVVRNDRYFRGAPILKLINYYYMADGSTRELGMQSGELDVAMLERSQASVDRMKAAGIPSKGYAPGSVVMLYFNESIPPFDSLDVRKAICYAIDREAMRTYFGDICDAVYSQTPPPAYMVGGLSRDDVASAGYDWMLTPDLTKAKALLAAAGYPDGFKMKVQISPLSSQQPVMEILQAQLKKVGIDLELDLMDFNTYAAKRSENVVPIVIYGAPRPNADQYLTQFWHSASDVASGSKPLNNYSHYNKIDQLIEDARASTDPALQEELWETAQLQILRDAAAYPVVFLSQHFAIQKYVDLGYSPYVGWWNLTPTYTETTRILQR